MILKRCFTQYTIFSDEPEIQVEKAWVHADVGIEAEISCNVHAVPAASVSFKRFILYFQSFLEFAFKSTFFAYLLYLNTYNTCKFYM